MKRHLKRTLSLCLVVCAMLCCGTTSLAEYIFHQRPEIKLGPLFADMYDPEVIRALSNELASQERDRGRYGHWSYEEKATLCAELEQVDNLPQYLMFSRVPSGNDLPEKKVVELSWEALIHAYPTVEENRVWYERGYVINYGIKQGHEEPSWWVVYYPYPTDGTFVDPPGKQPHFTYTVQLSRKGKAVDVIERDDTEVIKNEAIDPLTILLFYMGDMHLTRYQGTAGTSNEEKLDFNYRLLFPHITGDLVLYGLPESEHLSNEDAAREARAHAAMIRPTDTRLQNAKADAGFFIWDNANGSLRPMDAYPIWRVRFTDTDDAFLCTVVLDATTGELLEYQAIIRAD